MVDSLDALTSPINLFNLNNHTYMNQFYLAKSMEVKKAVIKTGECLFIPSFWWV